MKSIHRIGLAAMLTAVSASAWLACDSDDSSPANPGGGTDAASNTPDVTTTTGDDGGASGDASGVSMGDGASTAETGTGAETGAGGEGGALSCSTYCAAVMTTCTGNNKQYLDMNECMTTCALLPLGTAGATSGNTVGCRATHAALAASGGVVPHCWHAGPYGYGACGNECDNFCLLATTYCSAAGGFDAGSPPYASMSACTTACPGFAKVDDADGGPLGVDGGYNAAGPASSNTLDCREYHLQAALDAPGKANGQEFHCMHVGVTSPTCNQ